MTDRWTQKIDQITADFERQFGHLNANQVSWKPDLDTWSIAQNINHLILINDSYKPIISAIRNGSYSRPFLGRFGFLVQLMGNMILKSVQPDRTRKMRTFPIWAPAATPAHADILDKFARHQAELKNLVVTSSDLIDSGIVIPSPANKNIVYKLETAFDILVTHEQRHFEQAKEVAQLLPQAG